MQFGMSIYLLIGVVVVVALLLFLRMQEKKRIQKLHSFTAGNLLPGLTPSVSIARRRWGTFLLLSVVFCCFVALARPQYSFKWVDVKRKGIDILFAVDTSRSMLSDDIRPNRLERAKFGILDFVSRLEGDRVGLLPFAGSTYLLCPLTVDYEAFSQSLEVMDSSIIPKGGTNIAKTIRDANRLLTASSNHKILLLISDGETLEGDVLQAAREAAQNSMTIFTIGVGTDSGELIPVKENGKTTFLKDDAGNFVTSKLDRKSLKQISEITGGMYVPLYDSLLGSSGFEQIYKQKLAMIPKEELSERKHKIPIERFEYPLFAAIVLLMLEMLVGAAPVGRISYLKKIISAGRRKKPIAGMMILCVLAGCSMSGISPVYASKGEELYKQGKYDEAAQYYQKRLKGQDDNVVLNYNYGTAAYQQGKYEEAIEAFGKGIQSDNPQMQQRSYYNRGNALYKEGERLMQMDSGKAAELWKKALHDFTAAHGLDANDSAAEHNLEHVRKKLETLPKNEQQEQGSGNDQDSSQKTDDSDKEKQDQNHQNKKEDQQPESESNQSDSSGDENSDQQAESPNQQEQTLQNDGQQQGESESSSSTGQENVSGEEEENDSSTDVSSKEQQEAGGVSKEGETRQQVSSQQALPGEMSEEDARQLLESLQGEEKNFFFIPRNQTEQVEKDW